MKFKSIQKAELIWMLISVITMGLCLSYINQAAFGTDPCTTFNLAISGKLGLSLGNWQALFNCILFIFEFLFAKEQIGWGTIANMFLVGYSFDFFSWLNSLFLPEGFFQPMYVRILVTIPALFIFILAVAVYIAIQQGTAPYDAMPFIINKLIPKVPNKLVRMGWDIGFCIIGILFGGRIGIVTLIMAFSFGPAIAYAGKNIVPMLIHKKP
ncbi:MAG: hypothetical protein II247_00500 [Lachnospiraceae bacterium]|nr:hypothetical protein [Lachnospiraceae bacterium]